MSYVPFRFKHVLQRRKGELEIGWEITLSVVTLGRHQVSCHVPKVTGSKSCSTEMSPGAEGLLGGAASPGL